MVMVILALLSSDRRHSLFKTSSLLLPTQILESAVEKRPLLLVCEMALRLCFVLAALLMASFVCGTPFIKEKPGLCPGLKTLKIPGHESPCRNDYDCPTIQKCCPFGAPEANARICADPYFGSHH
ncbi:WAP four-disulfide core domain protein 18-like [Penaeus chinensis]|uniref:WAP four-disulfide core domain protein 18-like n=1 Tax=Penaeus chinensis TaxID=139456 RepID=UPI001FB85D79|nr:WAP four-disulfide core domain protein 18-like [Penaeus chinensis]